MGQMRMNLFRAFLDSSRLETVMFWIEKGIDYVKSALPYLRSVRGIKAR